MSARPLLLGHRGARAVKSIPENTLASFDRALADGCDGFEFDVRLTADGEAVVCHDAVFHDSKIAKIEIAAAAGSAVQGLPRLQDVLERYQQSAFLDIELKVSGLETTALELLEKYPPRRGFVLSSFLPEVLRAIRGVNSRVPLGIICENRAELGQWRGLPVEYVIPQRALVSRDLLDELKAAGRKVLVWTVNEREEMKRFAEWGMDGIVSDNTHLLGRVFDE
jgi:glycerophosphoryl diester phosphodiesterase